jgi:hypothetical protein
MKSFRIFGSTTFPDSRLQIPNQPAIDSQLAARLAPQFIAVLIVSFLSQAKFATSRAPCPFVPGANWNRLSE